jgi:DNA-binding transcriptional LysR family regulator
VPGASTIDLNLLVALGALLEERNVTRAGAKLNLSQPTMSGALARLRRHFGDELLVRSGRNYELTPAAQQLLPAVRHALQHVEQAFSRAPEFDPAISARRFSIAISGSSIVAASDIMLRRIQEQAPRVILELWPIAPELLESDRVLLDHDLMIAPLHARSAGQPEVIYRDRLVCLVDPGNPRLRDGRLSLADLQALPHATAQLPHAEVDPAGHVLNELGLARNVVMMTAGWLPLPFVVAGTDMVAIVPERLARRVSSAAGVTVTEPPFGRIETAEAAWWHPMRATDPALTWLRTILRQAAEP